MLRLLKKLIPAKLFKTLQPVYHRFLSYCFALWYGFPSRKLIVIGVTGTKGKSSMVEILNALFDKAGYQTAVAGTIRFKVGDRSWRNLFKMTMPGREYPLQRFLWEAHKAGCQYAFIEMTSEGAKVWRHAGIELDALIFTNLEPEHVESHGSFENYKACKLRLRDAVNQSKKKDKLVVANIDNQYGREFLEVGPGVTGVPFRLQDVAPHSSNDRGVVFTYRGTTIQSPLVGEFNIRNILAAMIIAEHYGVSIESMKKTLASFDDIPGRAQRIDAGQSFNVVVDYAHTPGSLEALYQAYPGDKICVLGSCGGGRDTWKRPRMGAIADEYCKHIILTDEDPYDEDPRQIVEEIATGIWRHKPEIVMDRRDAIKRALSLADARDSVLITGKGTDPFIMGPNDTKVEWSDAKVAREELSHLRL